MPLAWGRAGFDLLARCSFRVAPPPYTATDVTTSATSVAPQAMLLGAARERGWDSFYSHTQVVYSHSNPNFALKDYWCIVQAVKSYAATHKCMGT